MTMEAPRQAATARRDGREYEGRVRVAKLDVDANPRTSARYDVRSLPSILFFGDGAVVDAIVGAVPKSVIAQRIQQHV